MSDDFIDTIYVNYFNDVLDIINTQYKNRNLRVYKYNYDTQRMDKLVIRRQKHHY